MRHDSRERSHAANFAGFATMLICDMLLPVALYYLLRAYDVQQVIALLLSGVPVLLRNVAVFVRRRRIEGFGLFVLTVLLLSAVVSLITGSARLMLIRDGWFTAFIGLLTMGSMLTGKPMTFHALTTLLPHKAGLLERIYAEDAGFRRLFVLLGLIWGCGTLVDAGIRVWMAYTLPIDTVPALDTALSIVTFVVLQVITQLLLLRNARWLSLWRPRAARQAQA